MSSFNNENSMATMKEAVAAINSGTHIFDVTIICTTDDHQADYWMDRLQSGLLKKRDETSAFPLVLAVSEDWENGSGAGNGLGTLYAWTKAMRLANDKAGIDILKGLSDGSLSAALYHTAGKGTRLSPLPAGENNNKPGVKLPFPLQSTDNITCVPLTVLESVVKQTGLYARKGRLSVFWGDQVFLPTVPTPTKSTHHIDILCTLLPSAPDAQAWSEQGLDKYGVIAVMKQDHDKLEAAQVEKVSHETATRMLSSLGNLQQVGPSLGSFSVSAVMLKAFLSEFASEIEKKTDKLDTDPHFWMPLTLPKESYVELMEQKGTHSDESSAHFERMNAFKSTFDVGNLGFFGAVDVGQDACWWDYGQLKLYSKNSLLLLEESDSAQLLREYLGVTSSSLGSSINKTVQLEHSYVFGSRLGSGAASNSILAGVAAQNVQLDGAIVVNCAAKKIVAGPGAILYNLIDESDEGLDVPAGGVRVGVTNEAGELFVLQSSMDVDGGKAWKEKVAGNDKSFEEVHESNKNANIGEIAKKRNEHYDKVVASMGM